MGKTTVAVAAAHALSSDFDNSVYFVDLGTIGDETRVTHAVASAIGCFVQSQDPMQALLAFIADKRILIVLDNCEHVIGAAAALAERLVKGAPYAHLLTTTREALRAEGENVYLLLPLENPVDGPFLTAKEALTFPAVQLFVETAAASGHRPALSDEDAPVVVEICSRLEGIALAIELAASRVGAYGIRGIADLLNNRFRLLWHGRRTALPRHQTLQSMLDWSFNLLSEDEQKVLCRLSVFVGNFTLDAAGLVAAGMGADTRNVANLVASLVEKSLIWISRLDGVTYYRLLDTTREYAAEKLSESGEDNTAARSHALHYANYFSADLSALSAFDGHGLAADSPHTGNVRAALEWSFTEDGDTAIGIDLASRSASLFVSLSLLGECERWCERGLSALQDSDRGTERELALLEALAMSSMFTRGNSDEVRVAIERGLALAQALGNPQRELHLLAGLNIFATRIGDFRGALTVAERSVAVAGRAGEPAGIVMAEWMLGVTHHLVGDQAAAQRHCERGLEMAAASGHVDVHYFGYDHRVRALVALARTLWLRGLPERALKMAQQAIEAASARKHPVTLCISYIYTIPVFLWTGDLIAAEERIERLIELATRYSLAPYRAVGLALRGELMLLRAETAAGVQVLRDALTTLHSEKHHILATSFSRALAEGLAASGQFESAMATIRSALTLGVEGGQAFALPDLLRAQAQIMLAAPHPGMDAAEDILIRSLDCARKQSALGWEMRAAIPLARLWSQEGRADDARAMLSGIHQQFSEGFDTADLIEATHLLHELGTPRVP